MGISQVPQASGAVSFTTPIVVAFAASGTFPQASYPGMTKLAVYLIQAGANGGVGLIL